MSAQEVCARDCKMTHTRTTGLYTKIFLLILGVAALGGSLWYYKSHTSEGVYDYDPTLDRAFIINLFKNDMYWLISDYSAKDYSVERMLDYKASSRETSGDLILKTYRVKGQPVGFTAYYIQELFIGRILFVSVDKAFRSKGYARKMVNYVIADLKKRGVRIIRMITRTDNIPAQKLYKSIGFKEFWTDGAYMMLEKEI